MAQDPGQEYALLSDCTQILLDTLKRVPDDVPGSQTLVPGWDAAHLTAHIHHNAEAISRLIGWVTTGVRAPMYASIAARDAEIEASSRVPMPDLKRMVAASAEVLAEEIGSLQLRDLAQEVVTIHNRNIPVSATVWIRTKEVAIHAVDYDCQTSFDDLPMELLRRLLREVTEARVDKGELGELCSILTGRNLYPNLQPWL